MGLLDIFRGNSLSEKSIGLSKPGDVFKARITKSNREVVTLHKDNGRHKWSATRYPNGTVVETKTTKIK